MGIEYAMAPFGPEIIDAYARLFPGDQDKSPEVLAWRFRDNPHGPGMFAVARGEGLIQGMIALVPTALRVGGGRAARGFQAIDTIVNPELQGRFVFIKLGRLAEDFIAAQDALLWGFPNAAAARGWFGRLGWTRTGSAPFLIRPLRSGYVFRRFAPALARLDFRLARGRSGSPAGGRDPAIDERWQRLWDAVGGQPGIAVDRSAAWLRWRLAKPGAGYEWAYADDDTAFIATRTLTKHGGVIAYVMEALGASAGGPSLTALLRREMARLATDSGAEVALAWCGPQSPAYRGLRKAGFLPFPDRFRPAEIHHGFWQPAGDGAPPVAPEPWHLSYLDSDTV